ncbi:hypothetical protein EYF80_024774 [Liparis tanakae]|uniref:Uncharacterized protein n=1 Tax=Liparis tanakae TaxID=230148 RepID=A0A4Z2HIC9_9TELE|nr:hypothetical protein EYF80_024774 [Liparis tanakae]
MEQFNGGRRERERESWRANRDGCSLQALKPSPTTEEKADSPSVFSQCPLSEASHPLACRTPFVDTRQTAESIARDCWGSGREAANVRRCAQKALNIKRVLVASIVLSRRLPG